MLTKTSFVSKICCVCELNLCLNADANTLHREIQQDSERGAARLPEVSSSSHQISSSSALQGKTFLILNSPRTHFIGLWWTSHDQNFQTWIIGKWTTPREQYRAPSGTHFHQFVVPPIIPFRRDCTYGKLAAMRLPDDVEGLGSCEVRTWKQANPRWNISSYTLWFDWFSCFLFEVFNGKRSGTCLSCRRSCALPWRVEASRSRSHRRRSDWCCVGGCTQTWTQAIVVVKTAKYYVHMIQFLFVC